MLGIGPDKGLVADLAGGAEQVVEGGERRAWICGQDTFGRDTFSYFLLTVLTVLTVAD